MSISSNRGKVKTWTSVLKFFSDDSMEMAGIDDRGDGGCKVSSRRGDDASSDPIGELIC